MARKEYDTITASEVANYVVCPEAWRLKRFQDGRKRTTDRSVEGQKRRQDWVEKQDLSEKLRAYTKVAYALLVLIVILVFILDKHWSGKNRLINHVKKQNSPITSPITPGIGNE